MPGGLGLESATELIMAITLGDYPVHADHCSSVEVTSVGAAACGRMQVAYALACVVVHQRAHQLVSFLRVPWIASTRYLASIGGFPTSTSRVQGSVSRPQGRRS